MLYLELSWYVYGLFVVLLCTCRSRRVQCTLGTVSIKEQLCKSLAHSVREYRTYCCGWNLFRYAANAACQQWAKLEPFSLGCRACGNRLSQDEVSGESSVVTLSSPPHFLCLWIYCDE